MLLGITFVMAGSCVYNNYLDREIDRKMERTNRRALATGRLTTFNALGYGTVLLIVGCLLLGAFTNLRTLCTALFGVIIYVFVYGYFKRRNSLSTVVGSVAGAVPPVVGYIAVTNNFDGGALLLFLVLVFWQMPHFYSIAIYRYKDYKNAGLPVLPVKHGFRNTKIQILLYIGAFAAASILLSALGYSSWIYLVVSIFAFVYWLSLGIKGWKLNDPSKWARKMFGASLLVLLAISCAMIINSIVWMV